VHEEESTQQKAIRLLTRQLKELGAHICGLNDDQHHDFKAWRDTTREVLERYLGKESHHTTRFRDTRFHGPSYVRSDYPGVPQGPSRREIDDQVHAFQKGCATASATLQAAIKHVDDFGVYEEPAKAVPAKRRATTLVGQKCRAVIRNKRITRFGRVSNDYVLVDLTSADQIS
jgi:hypothetical protein